MQIADPNSLARLAEAVKSRRRKLKLRQEDVSARGGPSKASLYMIENGQASAYNDATIESLESALRWQPGAVAAIVKGEEPELLSESDFDGTVEDLDNNAMKLQYRGMTIVLTPTDGADRQRLKGQIPEVVAAIMERLDRLNLE